MWKKIIFLTLIFLLLNTSQNIYAWTENSSNRTENKIKKTNEDKWLGWDKFGHFFISGFLSGSSYSIYHKSFNNDKESSLYFAGTFTLSLGIGKEITDMKKPQNKFSYKDLIFDLMGISLGLIVASN
ncbi:MAG: DUF2279 domain-containing protein [candidate division Zixibacteria bacterium]|nr:DUF2279 domain-containing protein [candidate division Zixibacteria bacterium]